MSTTGNGVGYQPQAQRVELSTSRQVDFKLGSSEQQLTEVVVTGRSSQANISQAQAGVESLDLREVVKVPVLFGEKDVIKTMTLLPGVNTTGSRACSA